MFIKVTLIAKKIREFMMLKLDLSLKRKGNIFLACTETELMIKILPVAGILLYVDNNGTRII